MVVYQAIGAYLVLGIIALGLLDLFTGRVRNRLKEASYEAQDKLAKSGSFVGVRTAMVLTLLALWLFWVVAIYGALKGAKGGQSK